MRIVNENEKRKWSGKIFLEKAKRIIKFLGGVFKLGQAFKFIFQVLSLKIIQRHILNEKLS